MIYKSQISGIPKRGARIWQIQIIGLNHSPEIPQHWVPGFPVLNFPSKSPTRFLALSLTHLTQSYFGRRAPICLQPSGKPQLPSDCEL